MPRWSRTSRGGTVSRARANFDGLHVWPNRKILSQDAQKGRPARPQGARRPKRISFPPAHPELPRQLNHRGGTLQGDGRLRTMHGKGRVSARLGRAGEKSDFFSILLTSRATAANRGSNKAPNRDLAPYNNKGW